MTQLLTTKEVAGFLNINVGLEILAGNADAGPSIGAVAGMLGPG